MRNTNLLALAFAGVSLLAVPGSHAQAAASKDTPMVTDRI